MYLSIIFLPLFSSILTGFGGKFIGSKGAVRLSVMSMLTANLLAWVAFFEVGLSSNTCHISLLSWFNSGDFTANWGFLFDSLSVLMLVVVTTVSAMVHIFSTDYMGQDPHLPRFMSYLSFFTFFMLMLVTADNFLQLFFGWEGVGLCSFLLINFWFTRKAANQAALKAFLMNRIGDFGFALGIFICFNLFKSMEFEAIFCSLAHAQTTTYFFLGYEFDIFNLMCICLFIGAVGKSSQIGLHTWLPDAMEGPTPVSALIHAATMVTAGIYMILRCSPLFEMAPTGLLVVAFMGAMTAFFAASTGLLQNDLKKVIAYSTCSQLGYMAFACGISKYSVSYFHLVNHAFFKALLFLSAGSVIHAMADQQDMRKMGATLRTLPLTYVMILIGSLALTGVPFLSGFYSKDAILEFASVNFMVKGNFTFWLGIISAGFTSFYSFRLLYLTFLNNSNSNLKVMSNVHDMAPVVVVALVPLCLGSIFSGFLGRDMFIGLATPFWINSLEMDYASLEMEFMSLSLRFMPLVFTLLGSFLAWHFYNSSPQFGFYSLLSILPVMKFLNKKWYFDKIYDETFLIWSMNFGRNITFNLLDRYVFELFGPSGIRVNLVNAAKNTIQLQSGYIYHYSLLFIVGVVGLNMMNYVVSVSGGWSSIAYLISGTLFVLFWGGASL